MLKRVPVSGQADFVLRKDPIRRFNHEGLGLQTYVNPLVFYMSQVESEMDIGARLVLMPDFLCVPFRVAGVGSMRMAMRVTGVSDLDGSPVTRSGAEHERIE